MRETSRSGGVLALRAAGAGLPKRWPCGQRGAPTAVGALFEFVSALDVGSDGFRERAATKARYDVGTSGVARDVALLHDRGRQRGQTRQVVLEPQPRECLVTGEV